MRYLRKPDITHTKCVKTRHCKITKQDAYLSAQTYEKETSLKMAYESQMRLEAIEQKEKPENGPNRWKIK